MWVFLGQERGQLQRRWNGPVFNPISPTITVVLSFFCDTAILFLTPHICLIMAVTEIEQFKEFKVWNKLRLHLKIVDIITTVNLPTTALWLIRAVFNIASRNIIDIFLSAQVSTECWVARKFVKKNSKVSTRYRSPEVSYYTNFTIFYLLSQSFFTVRARFYNKLFPHPTKVTSSTTGIHFRKFLIK